MLLQASHRGSWSGTGAGDDRWPDSVAKARLHLEKGHKDVPVLSLYEDTILLLYTCQCIKYHDYLVRTLGCSEDRFDFT